MTSTPESPKPTEPDSTEPEKAETPQTPEAEATVEEPAKDDAAPDPTPDPVPVFADTSSSPAPPAAPAEVEAESDVEVEDDDEVEEEYEEVATGPQGPDLVQAAGAVVGLLVLVSVLLVALGLPALKGSPHDVPIGVAGPQQVTSQLAQLFEQDEAGGFDVSIYPDEAALREAVSDRDIYGGLSFTATSGTMLVASGGSPVVAESLASVANNLGSSASIQIPVDDVAPMPSDDPRGTGFAAIGLPLVIAGVLPGLLMLSRRFRSSLSTMLGVTFVFSVLAGFALGGILQFGFGSVEGNFLVTALTISLGVAAIAFPLTGLGAIAGRIGVAIGAAVMLLLGYPLAGIATAPEWLSGIWATIGQLLPPGAEIWLLRSTAFFDGSGGGTALIVLGAWTLGGLVLVVIGALLNPADAFDEDEVEAEETEEVLTPA